MPDPGEQARFGRLLLVLGEDLKRPTPLLQLRRPWVPHVWTQTWFGKALLVLVLSITDFQFKLNVVDLKADPHVEAIVLNREKF